MYVSAICGLSEKTIDKNIFLSSKLDLDVRFGRLLQVSGLLSSVILRPEREIEMTGKYGVPGNRSQEVYKTLSEPETVSPLEKPKRNTSVGSLISEDVKISWNQKIWLNLR